MRDEVEDEIEFHLEQLVAYYVSCGASPDDARRLAQHRFGNRDGIARSMRVLASQRERTMRRIEWLRGVGRDLRYGIRQLAKRPAFTAIALITLALGIGANTAIFSAVNAVLLHPVATHDIGRVMVVRTNLPTLNLMNAEVGPGEALDLMKRADLFDASGAWSGRGAILTEQGDAQRLMVTRTLGKFFDVFGNSPALGRFYRSDESEPGKEQVAVLSYALWQALGANQHAVGTFITLDGARYEVAGVTPAGFDYPRGSQVYVPAPMTAAYAQNRVQMIWNVVGRIKTGLSPAQFVAGIHDEQLRWHSDPALNYKNSTQFLSVVPLATLIAGQLQPVLLVLLGAVGFVLLIACANIASLQLVHGTARTRELAVRVALGAGRGTIVLQIFVENLVLCVVGGVLGIATGAAILRLMEAAGAAELPALAGVHLDAHVLAYSIAATMLAGVLFGLLPALRAGRIDVHEGLKEGRRGVSLSGGTNRALQTGIIVQVALALVLLLGSGLLIRSLRQLLAQPPGFNPEHIVTVRLSASVPKYTQHQGAVTTLYNDVLARLRAMPGFTSVGLVSELPFSGMNSSSTFAIRGRAADPAGPALHSNMHTIGGDYFTTMGIPLIKGRVFDKTDIATPNQSLWTVVVDETFAKTFFPNEDPIGKQINMGPDATIIGVVGTVSQGDLGEPPKATVYYPHTQHDYYYNVYIVARTTLPLQSAIAGIRGAVAAVDPSLPLFEPRTLTDRIDASLAPRRLAMIVLSGLAALSVGLAVFGLYGVISYAVSQRTAEFGIRVALGAQTSDVHRLVMRQGVWLAAIGIVLGLMTAVLSTQALQSLLFGVSSRDPLTFIGAPALFVVVAAMACYIPARRATRVDPTEALRAS